MRIFTPFCCSLSVSSPFSARLKEKNTFFGHYTIIGTKVRPRPTFSLQHTFYSVKHLGAFKIQICLFFFHTHTHSRTHTVCPVAQPPSLYAFYVCVWKNGHDPPPVELWGIHHPTSTPPITPQLTQTPPTASSPSFCFLLCHITKQSCFFLDGIKHQLESILTHTHT